MGREGVGRARRHAQPLRVGVGDPGVEPRAPQDDQHPVLGLVGEDDIDAGHVDALAQEADDLPGRLVVDPPGPAVDHQAVVVERGQVAPSGDVTRAQLDLQAGGRQHPPPQLVLVRVVAEQSEVPGARPRGDPGAHRVEQADGAFGGQCVEVRRVRLLELGAAGAVGEPSEAVDDDEDGPGVRRLSEAGKVGAHWEKA